MVLHWFDYVAFVLFMAVVVGVSLYASRKQESSEDYFLAGRALPFWLIGFSLIASNISTEHFVGMAGQGFGSIGMAVASYEWIAAITLVFVAIFLLPVFLKSGIFTIPEFLEYRFSPAARAIMATYMMIAYVFVAIAAVLYSGAIAINTIFGLDLVTSVWLIGLLAGAYTVYGGLKAVVWSDLIQGAALLIGGIVITILGFKAVGGVDAFFTQNADKLHTILPRNHPDMPWTILLAGIWIPNIFYWGLNQFITQRTLGAKSLAEGQRGIILAAWLKLIIPFIIIFPGIMAFQLYGDTIKDADQAYPYMIKHILPNGLTGLMFAALFGAVMSSLDSMLNSASTIVTMDLYKRYLKPEADPKILIKFGRVMTAVFVVVGCIWASVLVSQKDSEVFSGIFDYIQKVWGFFSPGIVAVFIFGLVIKKAPPLAAIGSLLINVPLYGFLLWYFDDMPFLNAMVIILITCWVFMGVVTLIKPLEKPVEMPVTTTIDLRSTPGAKILGAITVLATICLYIIFR